MKVLIVEDEEEWWTDISQTTIACGHEPIRAPTLQEAFALLDANPDIAAVITDINLGNYGDTWHIGLDVLKKVSEDNKQIPCYAHSSVDGIPAGIYFDLPIDLSLYITKNYGSFAKFHLKERGWAEHTKKFLNEIAT